MMSFRQSSEFYAHVDCNSFYASCETFRNPTLQGKFVCVGDQIVIAASYEAKGFGIKTGTPMWEAERILGKKLVRMLPDHAFYQKMSKKLMDYMKTLLGSIEVYSVDEFFGNVSGLCEEKTPIGYCRLAEQLKNDIRKNIGLPVSVGIANTRIRAKIFSDLNKPSGSYVSFSKENIEQLFRELPIRDVPYIARGNSEKLGSRIKTIFDFYDLDPRYVREILGKNGIVLWLELHGVDVWAPNDIDRKRKSIVCSRSFNHSMTSDREIIWRHLLENLERAYDTLMREKQEVRTVSIQLKDKEFQNFWISRDLGERTIDRSVITTATKGMFEELFERTKIYRTTGIQFSELQPYIPKQTSIFEIENQAHRTNDRMAETMSLLKKRYGCDIINQGYASDRRPAELHQGMEILFEAK